MLLNLNAFIVLYAYAATTALLKKFHPQAYLVVWLAQLRLRRWKQCCKHMITLCLHVNFLMPLPRNLGMQLMFDWNRLSYYY